MAREPGGDHPAGAAISDRLDALKRDGSCLLVVGTPRNAHQTVCHRLLGATDAQSRYRLVATAPEDDTVFDAPDDRRHDPNHVLAYSGADGQDGADTLTDLGSDIIAAIDRFETDADDPDPAALRVCVDSVTALTADNDDEEVFRFLHMTTSRIRQATGMGHYHFPVDRSAQAVHLFEPLFDAIVTVRAREGDSEHRWEFTNSDVTSEWIPL